MLKAQGFGFKSQLGHTKVVNNGTSCSLVLLSAACNVTPIMGDRVHKCAGG